MNKKITQKSSDWLKTKQFIWCSGCSMSWLTMALAKKFDDLNFKKENTWVISGIGCVGRVSNYFACNSAHTTHGRAIPVAEGIKMVNPDKNVFVVSGDGDLLSIGLSHLIHAARRNAPLKVVCVNNSIYGMTGGQSSPTTSTGLKTKSYPGGTLYTPLPVEKILKSIDNIYYRQVKGYDLKGFEEAIEEVIHHQGFGFVEVMAICITNDPRLKKSENKLKVAKELLK